MGQARADVDAVQDGRHLGPVRIPGERRDQPRRGEGDLQLVAAQQCPQDSSEVCEQPADRVRAGRAGARERHQRRDRLGLGHRGVVDEHVQERLQVFWSDLGRADRGPAPVLVLGPRGQSALRLGRGEAAQEGAPGEAEDAVEGEAVPGPALELDDQPRLLARRTPRLEHPRLQSAGQGATGDVMEHLRLHRELLGAHLCDDGTDRRREEGVHKCRDVGWRSVLDSDGRDGRLAWQRCREPRLVGEASRCPGRIMQKVPLGQRGREGVLGEARARARLALVREVA
mmetsp:Transcript_46624/g.137761  ORF Transcript_46624/g.137761 Transcript_46624/m.137761 type:complete len:285 (-) Transcript_46624:298-1152(-)